MRGPRGSSAPCLSSLTASPSEERGVREVDPAPQDTIGVERCLGWVGSPGLWGHAKEGFLCMWKGILWRK